MNDDLLQSMRLMAWERAKGELRSIGHASYSAADPARHDRVQRFFATLQEFIKTVEDEGLIE